MIVDVQHVLLTAARERIRYATSEYLADDLSGVDEPMRSFYLRNRLTVACRLLTEAVDCIRIAETKLGL